MTALCRGLAPRMRQISPRRAVTIAALDIGTNKVSCTIARLRPFRGDEAIHGRTHSIEVLGLGQVRASGLKAGAVTDLARAEESVRQAVTLAEQTAGVEIASVVLALSGGRIGGESFSAAVPPHAPPVR